MADECGDPRCGAIFPQGHLSGCANSSRPPKGRTGWDANAADAERERWAITLEFVGTAAEAGRYFKWFGDKIPDEFIDMDGSGSGWDSASIRRIDEEVWNVDA